MVLFNDFTGDFSRYGDTKPLQNGDLAGDQWVFANGISIDLTSREVFLLPGAVRMGCICLRGSGLSHVFLHQKCINSGISKPNHTSLLIEIPHDIF
jgi:hypothetical protein